MSNIGSISNSGNKFNVVASTLSTEQLESFGKSGNLMPNAIIVSTSYINSYDNSLDLVISDKDGYGQSIMKDYKNAIETVSQHIYFTSNTAKPKYKTKYVQEGENGNGPETISLNKAIYTFAKDYSYIGSRFLTYDGKYSLNDYFSYLFSIIKHEKTLITVTDLVLNSTSSTPGYVTFKVSPNYNKDYITVGFKNGKNEPNIRFYNSFEGKLKGSDKNITDDVKAEFNTNDLLESKCYIIDRDVSTSYISINSPNYDGEVFSSERKITCYVTSDITTQNYKTYGTYYKDVLVGIEGHNSNITVYDNGIPIKSHGAILDKFPVENEGYRNLEVKFDNGLQLYYNGNSDNNSAKAYFNIDGGKLKSSDDGLTYLTYSYKSVIYPAYNDQKQIIVNHKWINPEGRKNTNIYIKPNPSIFLVNKNDNDHRYYLTYNTGNYIPTDKNSKNRFLPISNKSHVSCKNYSKKYGWTELSSNFITYDINTYSTALEIKDTAYEITDDIHYHGVYKVNVECTNTYLDNTYINNDKYYIVCSTELNIYNNTAGQRRTLAIIDSQDFTEYFRDLKDLYVNNKCSYLADKNKILYIGVNYSINGSEWVKDPNNIYYYQITSVEESDNTSASKFYKYKIDKNETSDSLYIIFGLRDYKDKDNNFTTPDVPESSNIQNYYIKFNIYFRSNNNRINISENCKIKYWYTNNGTRYEYTENIESTKTNQFSIPNIAVLNKLLKYQIIKNNNVDLQYDDVLFDDDSGKVRDLNINLSEINITLPSSKINESTIQFNINKISMPFLKLDYEDYNKRGYKYVVLNVLNNSFILCTLEPYETEISDINVTIEDKENILYNKDCVFTVYYHANNRNITDISDLSTISTDIECITDPNPIIVDSKIIYINELNFKLEY